MQASESARTRAMVVTMVVLVAATIFYVVAQVTSTPGTDDLWRSLVAYSLPSAIAAVLALQRAFVSRDAVQAWIFLAAALAADVAGNTLFETLDPEEATGLQAIAPDAVWLLFYPFALLFLVILARRRLALRLNHAWLDALVIGSAAFTALFGVINAWLDVLVPASLPAASILSGLYVFGDLSLIVVTVTIMWLTSFRLSAGWWLAMVGVGVFGIADSAYFALVATDGYAEGGLLDLLWPVSSLLIGLAAFVGVPQRASRRSRPSMSYLVPGGAVLTAAVVLAVNPTGPFQALTAVMALLAIALGTLRMVQALRDVESLGRELSNAQIDPLTGLPNMRALRAISESRIDGASLIVLNISSFAELNISMGHEAGDRLLQLVAERLSTRLRDRDRLARIAGDTFAVFLPHTEPGSAAIVAEGLITLIEQPLTINGATLHFTACAGVAGSDPEEPGLQPLLSNAEDALLQARGDGPGLVREHDGGHGRASAQRLLLRSQLREDFDKGGHAFVVYYQPIVRIADNSVMAVEALVRRRHDGIVESPGTFLRELVQAGLVGELTSHMLVTGLTELRRARLDFPVAVNVVPELVNQQLVDQVAAALRSTGSRPDQLLIEITEETLLRTPEAASGVLATLRAMGIWVELDDFGTGWSGLSSLRDLAVDALKIDQSFVARMTTDRTAHAIVHGVAQVADELGLTVIFEGVEDEEVEALLRAEYQGAMQGFLIGRPMPIDDLVRWHQLRGR